MFSGIIAEIGTITCVDMQVGGLRLTVLTDRLGLDDVQTGDSIAVNGACLTVVEKNNNAFTVDVSGETLSCTTGLATQGARVNLEKALRLSDRLNGHLVSGHIDGVGEVVAVTALGENRKLSVRAPQAMMKYIAPKGAITINGVNLTVNELDDAVLSINLIPHTLKVTTLSELQAGSTVNVEVDLIARYVERMMQTQRMGD